MCACWSVESSGECSGRVRETGRMRLAAEVGRSDHLY